MLEDLQQFGLSEKEARVYLSSLEIGSATADTLSKHSGVNRSTTYVQIEELMKLGLMSTYEDGKKTMYLPESPEHLKRLFERQKQKIELQEKQLDSVMPGLAGLFSSAGERPKVRFFEGKEGLVTMRQEVLHCKSKQIEVISSYDDFVKVFDSEKERMAFTAKRVAKKIHIRLLFTYEGKMTKKMELAKARKIPQEKMPIAADIQIYDDTVAT